MQSLQGSHHADWIWPFILTHVGNALCGVPKRNIGARVSETRNGTMQVPYRVPTGKTPFVFWAFARRLGRKYVGPTGST